MILPPLTACKPLSLFITPTFVVFNIEPLPAPKAKFLSSFVYTESDAATLPYTLIFLTYTKFVLTANIV